jgi:dihydrofolate reductase
MRKLIYHVASTLDGFIANTDGSFDGFPGEGDHVSDYLNSLDSYDAVVMGRKTYEVALRTGVTNPYPRLKTYVFSRTIEVPPDNHVEIISGSAATALENIKKQSGGDIYLCGGADLAGQLFRAALVDEVKVKLNPVLFGVGIPLVPPVGRRIDLHLTGTKTYESGVMLLTYRVKH